MNWIPAEIIPVRPGQLSPLLLVRCEEFGCAPAYALARCWVSSETPLLPKFYLDRISYDLPNLREIAQQVTGYIVVDDKTEAG